jgi:hypothetical protein
MKNRLHNLLCAFALSAATLVSGCATPTGGKSSVTKEDILTALEIAAALTIGDDLKKVQTALEIVADARRVIRDGEAITASNLIDYVAAQALRSTDLDVAAQIAIRSFLERYRANFTIEVGQVGLDPEILVTVSEALDSIEAVALEIQRYGKPLERSYLSVERQRLTHDQKADFRHMLANPEPLPADVEAYFAQ